jgi:hypothetical protein
LAIQRLKSLPFVWHDGAAVAMWVACERFNLYHFGTQIGHDRTVEGQRYDL